jgi:hypothetical protein
VGDEKMTNASAGGSWGIPTHNITNRRQFYVAITTCYDCPYKEWGLRKCSKTDKWFEFFEIENGIIDWCPMIQKLGL